MILLRTINNNKNFKMKYSLYKLFAIGMAVSTMLVFSTCKNKTSKIVITTLNTDNKISIAYTNDSESKVFTYLCSHILRNKEYDVKMVELPIDSIYEQLATKNIDIYLNARLPDSQKKYFDMYKNKLNILGDSYERVTSGLIVNQYVHINTITQLNHNAHKFGNTIYVSNNNEMSVKADSAIRKYKLNFKMKIVNPEELDQLLKQAEKEKKWIVFSDCKPSVVWANFKLKYLSDPLKTFPDERYMILSKVGFKFDQPEIALFLNNFVIPENYFEELTLYLKENNDDYKIIENWYKEHKETVQSWFPDVWIDN